MSYPIRTVLTIQPLRPALQYEDGILAIGSCFAENISAHLIDCKFKVEMNPFGILFNPVSIGNALCMLADQKMYGTADIFSSDGLWFSYDHHGRFAHPDSEQMLEQINTVLARSRQALRNAKWVILTLGTAHVWTLKSSGVVVANCHKQDADTFQRRLLSKDEVLASLNRGIQEITRINPSIEVLLTVSPVRYTRDGLVDSSRSKARLLLACETLEQLHSNVHYYPVYELVIDELRDYVFFELGGTHPNQLAINIVWERLVESWLDEDTRAQLGAIEKIKRAISHKALHPASQKHQAFKQKTLKELQELANRLPFLDFTLEKSRLLKQN